MDEAPKDQEEIADRPYRLDVPPSWVIRVMVHELAHPQAKVQAIPELLEMEGVELSSELERVLQQAIQQLEFIRSQMWAYADKLDEQAD